MKVSIDLFVFSLISMQGPVDKRFLEYIFGNHISFNCSMLNVRITLNKLKYIVIEDCATVSGYPYFVMQ